MSNKTTAGQQKRVAINRKAILNAARDLFIENGFKKNSMLDISRHAGLGYGTLYTHFTGRNDILEHLLNEITDDFDQLVNHPYTPRTILEVEKRTQKEICYLLSLARKHRSILKVAYQAKGQSKPIEDYCNGIIHRYVEKTLTDYSYSLEQKLAKPGYNSNYVAKAFVYVITEFFWDVVVEKEDDIEDISKNLTSFYMYGVYFDHK